MTLFSQWHVAHCTQSLRLACNGEFVGKLNPMILDVVYLLARKNTRIRDTKAVRKLYSSVRRMHFSLGSLRHSNENSRINIHRVSSQCTPVSFPLLDLFYLFSAYAVIVRRFWYTKPGNGGDNFVARWRNNLGNWKCAREPYKAIKAMDVIL